MIQTTHLLYVIICILHSHQENTFLTNEMRNALLIPEEKFQQYLSLHLHHKTPPFFFVKNASLEVKLTQLKCSLTSKSSNH